MQHATIQISTYISAQGVLVAEDPVSGIVTILDGLRLLRGRPIAPVGAESTSARSSDPAKHVA